MDSENNGSNPIKIHDLGVPLFLETPIYCKDLVHHPIDPTIYKQMFQVLGTNTQQGGPS